LISSFKKQHKFGRLVAQVLLSFCLIISINFGALEANQSSYNESLVRAAVIFGILRFTDWPEVKAPDEQVKLCAYGPSPSANAISELKNIPGIGSTRVIYEFIDRREDLGTCHAVIVGKNVSLERFVDTPTLLICDGCSADLSAKSAINLSKSDNRIQFEVNLDRVEEQQLSLSSSLIELAARCSSSNPAIRGCNE